MNLKKITEKFWKVMQDYRKDKARRLERNSLTAIPVTGKCFHPRKMSSIENKVAIPHMIKI